MNLVGLMIAVAMMSVGALTSAFFLIDPPLALSRLSAQAQADSIVEMLRQAAWRGKRVQVIQDASNTITGVTVDGEPLSIPSNCNLTQPQAANQTGGQYVSVTCVGANASNDSRQGQFRSSQTALIGGVPCDSDLFPTPTLSLPSGNLFLCQEWDNSPPPPTNQDPMVAGHFDLDSYPGFSTKGLHVHRWDDKFTAFISSSAPGLFDLMRSGDVTPCGPGGTSTIPVCSPLGVPKAIPEVLAISQPFYLLITNGNLSPMMLIRFRYTNSAGVQSPVITCTQDPQIVANNASTRPFNACFVVSTTPVGGQPLTALRFINTPDTPPPGFFKLDYLYVGFSRQDPHFAGGVVPTATGKVNGTRSTPGVCGEYRNGAFVIQAVSDIPATLYRITSATVNPTAGIPYSCGAQYGGLGSATVQSAAPPPPAVGPTTTATITGTPFSFNGANYISNGGNGLAVSNVLYEISVFWHANNGYNVGMQPMYYPLVASSVSVYLNQ